MAFTYTGEQVDLGFGRGWLSRPAAASIRRIDRQIGHPLQITEAGRTFFRQEQHWLKYLRDGYPIALNPNTPSEHQKGLSIDSDEAQRIIAILEDHGWRRTVYRWVNGKWTLVERWHFEYFAHLDNHRNDPAGASSTPAPHVPKEDEIMEAYVAVPSGAVVHLFPGGRHIFGSKQEYDAYRGDVNFIRARDGLSMATVPPLETVVNVNWAQFERFRRNFGVPDDGAFQGETIDVEKLAKDLAARMGYDVASLRAAVRAELATLTLKAG